MACRAVSVGRDSGRMTGSANAGRRAGESCVRGTGMDTAEGRVRSICVRGNAGDGIVGAWGIASLGRGDVRVGAGSGPRMGTGAGTDSRERERNIFRSGAGTGLTWMLEDPPRTMFRSGFGVVSRRIGVRSGTVWTGPVCSPKRLPRTVSRSGRGASSRRVGVRSGTVWTGPACSPRRLPRLAPRSGLSAGLFWGTRTAESVSRERCPSGRELGMMSPRSGAFPASRMPPGSGRVASPPPRASRMPPGRSPRSGRAVSSVRCNGSLEAPSVVNGARIIAAERRGSCPLSRISGATLTLRSGAAPSGRTEAARSRGGPPRCAANSCRPKELSSVAMRAWAGSRDGNAS